MCLCLCLFGLFVCVCVCVCAEAGLEWCVCVQTYNYMLFVASRYSHCLLWGFMSSKWHISLFFSCLNHLKSEFTFDSRKTKTYDIKHISVMNTDVGVAVWLVNQNRPLTCTITLDVCEESSSFSTLPNLYIITPLLERCHCPRATDVCNKYRFVVTLEQRKKV